MIRPHAHASDVRRVVSVRSGSWASSYLRLGIDQTEGAALDLGRAHHDRQEGAALGVRVVAALGIRRPRMELAAVAQLGPVDVGRQALLEIPDGPHDQAAIRLP